MTVPSVQEGAADESISAEDESKSVSVNTFTLNAYTEEVILVLIDQPSEGNIRWATLTSSIETSFLLVPIWACVQLCLGDVCLVSSRVQSVRQKRHEHAVPHWPPSHIGGWLPPSTYGQAVSTLLRFEAVCQFLKTLGR